MARFYYPLEIMQLRTERLASNYSATYGTVRNNNTTNHQGWDLHAIVGTRCYAIANGYVEWIRNVGSYGLQLGLSFNKNGSAGSSLNLRLAFYAHLSNINVVLGDRIGAGQLVGFTGTSGNASANAPHLHFEIRTATTFEGGFQNRVDPGNILGYGFYDSENVRVGGEHNDTQISSLRGRATAINQ